jgi:hypothetical protein
MAKADLDLSEVFTKEERERLRLVCRALRTSYKDFIKFATMEAISECEGYAQEARNNASFFNR